MKVIQAVSLLAVLGCITASHFRYGTISWEHKDGNKVTFTMESAWKRSFWQKDTLGSGSGSWKGLKDPTNPANFDNYVQFGDVFEVPVGEKGNHFYFGDETCVKVEDGVERPCTASERGTSNSSPRPQRARIEVKSPRTWDSIDRRLDNAAGNSVFGPHQYPSPQDGNDAAWVAGFYGCCRLTPRSNGDPNKGGSTNSNDDGETLANGLPGRPGGLNNNGYRSWNLQTTVDLTGGPSAHVISPKATGKAILRLRLNVDEDFDILAVDEDCLPSSTGSSNDCDLTFRLGDEEEFGTEPSQIGKTADGIRPNWPPGHPEAQYDTEFTLTSEATEHQCPGDDVENALPSCAAKIKSGRNLDEKYAYSNELAIYDKKWTIFDASGSEITYTVGVVTWDTARMNTGYWQATIMIDETSSKVSIPYDFLILLQNSCYQRNSNNEGDTYEACDAGTGGCLCNDPPHLAIKDESGRETQVFNYPCGKELKVDLIASDPQKGCSAGDEGCTDTPSISSFTYTYAY